MEIAMMDNASSFDTMKDSSVLAIFKECEHAEINQTPESINRMQISQGNISELTDNLVLCSASLVNPTILDVLNICCVVNVAPELPDPPMPAAATGLICHKIPILDSGNSRILAHFDEAADLIHKVANSGGKTLVYCVAGVSRSATVCLAYLMKHHGLTLAEAYVYVKGRRPRVRPNCGFFKQLIEYEEGLFGTSTVKMVYNELVQMEIPDVYNCEYQFAGQYRKRRNQNARY